MLCLPCSAVQHRVKGQSAHHCSHHLGHLLLYPHPVYFFGADLCWFSSKVDAKTMFPQTTDNTLNISAALNCCKVGSLLPFLFYCADRSCWNMFWPAVFLCISHNIWRLTQAHIHTCFFPLNAWNPRNQQQFGISFHLRMQEAFLRSVRCVDDFVRLALRALGYRVADHCPKHVCKSWKDRIWQLCVLNIVVFRQRWVELEEKMVSFDLVLGLLWDNSYAPWLFCKNQWEVLI